MDHTFAIGAIYVNALPAIFGLLEVHRDAILEVGLNWSAWIRPANGLASAMDGSALNKSCGLMNS